MATLKNAYRDRPPKKRRGAAAPDEDSDADEEPEETKKVPQSFTFLRREGWWIETVAIEFNIRVNFNDPMGSHVLPTVLMCLNPISYAW